MIGVRGKGGGREASESISMKTAWHQSHKRHGTIEAE